MNRLSPLWLGLSLLIIVLLAAACVTVPPAGSPPDAAALQAALAALSELDQPTVAWSELGLLPPLQVSSLATVPYDRRAAFALLANGELYHTTDRGRTWQALSLPVAPSSENAALPANSLLSHQDVSPITFQPGRVFVRAGNTLLRSKDGGDTWDALLDHVDVWAVEGDGGEFVMAWRWTDLPEAERGLYRSSDAGATWTQVVRGALGQSASPGPFPDSRIQVMTLLLDPFDPNVIYAGTNAGVLRSTNGGRTWQPFEDGLPPTLSPFRRVPLLLTGRGGTVYALTEVILERNSRRAVLARLVRGAAGPAEDHWTVENQEALQPFTVSGLGEVYALVADPVEPERLYLGAEQGLLVSRDAGATWQMISRGQRPDAAAVYRIAVAPGRQTQFYLDTAQGPGLLILPSSKPSPALNTDEEALPVQMVGQVGGQTLAVVARDDVAYLGIGPRLVTLNVSEPAAPQMLGQSAVLPGIVQGIAIAQDGGTGEQPGRTVAVVAAGEGGLRLLDVSDPAAPESVGAVVLSDDAQDVLVRGGMAYAAAGRCYAAVCEGSLHVIDITNPGKPQEVAMLEMPDFAYALAAVQDILIVAHGQGLQVIDVSDPAQPVERGTTFLPGGALDVAVVEGRDGAATRPLAYVANSGLLIFDLADPAHPLLAGRYAAVLEADAVAAAGDLVYVSESFCEFDLCGSSLLLLDVSDPTAPQEVGLLDVPGATVAIWPAAGYAFLANGEIGLAIVKVADPARPALAAIYGELGSVIDVVVADGLVAVPNVAESRLVVLDSSDPTAPRPVGALDGLRWGDGLVLGQVPSESGPRQIAYVPAWEDGLRMVELTDPTDPQGLGFLSTGGLRGAAYGVALARQGSRTYAYVAAGEDGLRVVDVNSRAWPKRVGRLDLPGRIWSVALAQRKAEQDDTWYAIAVGGDGEAATPGVLRVIEVTDPARPHEVGALGLPDEAQDVVVSAQGDFAYVATASCRQGACAGGLAVVAIAEPAAPRLTGFLDVPAGASSLLLVDDLAYVAAGQSGVWVVDVANPAQPHLVNHIDTPGNVHRMALAHTSAPLLYVADGGAGLLILRAGQPPGEN